MVFKPRQEFYLLIKLFPAENYKLIPLPKLLNGETSSSSLQKWEKIETHKFSSRTGCDPSIISNSRLDAFIEMGPVNERAAHITNTHTRSHIGSWARMSTAITSRRLNANTGVVKLWYNKKRSVRLGHFREANSREVAFQCHLFWTINA